VHARGFAEIVREADGRIDDPDVRRHRNGARQRHDVLESIDNAHALARNAEFFFEFAQGCRAAVGVIGVDDAAGKCDLARIATQMIGAAEHDEGGLGMTDDRDHDGGEEHLRRFEREAARPHKRSASVRIPNYTFDIVAIGAALAIRTFAPAPAWIETYYSNGAYPAIDRAVRALTGPLPFCLGDVLFVVAVLALVRYWFARLRRGGEARIALLAALARRTVAVGAALFVWFELSWAYGYARVPLTEKISVHNDRTNEVSVAMFGDRVTDRLSELATAAHREHVDDATFAARLVPTFDATIRRLGNRATFPPPRVKPTFFQPMMALSATSGFTDPWTHEINLDAGAFFYERPALYAHEWAHVAGFNDEAEANFIAVVACTTARDPLVQYSGWILVWFNLPADVHLTHRMGRRAYDDIMAIRARYMKQSNPTVARAQRIAYDGYLKSNHVKAGFASYRLFIRWMTGADFDRAGLPRVRG